LPVAVVAAQQPGSDLPPRVGGHAAPRLDAAYPVAWQTPQLLRVGPVHGVVQRLSEPGTQHAGVGVLPHAAQRPGGHIARDLGDQRRGELAGELAALQREAHPAARHPQPAVARPGLEVVAQQAPQVGQHARRSRRVKTVRPVVDADAAHLEGSGQPADPVGTFEQRDLEPSPGSSPRGGEPSGSGAEDDKIV